MNHRSESTFLARLLSHLDPAIWEHQLRPDVTVLARHNPNCKFQSPGLVSKCQCKKTLYVARTPLSKEARLSTYSRSWQAANDLAAEIRDSFVPKLREAQILKHHAQQAAERRSVRIEDALRDWIADKQKTVRKPASLCVYSAIAKQLTAFAHNHGWDQLSDLDDTGRLTSFRNSWKSEKNSGLKYKQNRFIAFFAFCVRQGWLQKNPAGGRANPEGGLSKVALLDKTPKPPFRPEQYQAILDAHWKLAVFNRRDSRDTPARMHTFTELLRWSGLAPIDAWKLRRDQLSPDGVIGGEEQVLARQKTGKVVVTQIPPRVADALRRVPPGRKSHPDYFFYNGSASDSSIRSTIWRHYDRVFRQIDPPLVLLNSQKQRVQPHPYTFRDTFAVEELKRGCDIHDLAKLMGNTVRVCEASYIDYVPELKEKILERQRARMAEHDNASPARPRNVVIFKRRPEVATGGL